MNSAEFLEFAKKIGALRKDRWEKGIPHHPRSEELLEFMDKADWLLNSGALDLKSGGDGDIGENMMYLMDAFFDAKDAVAKKNEGDPIEFVYRIVNSRGEYYGSPTHTHARNRWHKRAGKFMTLKAVKAVLDGFLTQQQKRSVYVQKFKLDNVANMIPSELP